MVRSERLAVLATLLTVGLVQPSAALATHSRCRPWKVVASPRIPMGYLSGASGASSSDVWAVGGDGYHPVVQHWDGTAWAQVASPEVPGTLIEVAAISPEDAWAVGTKFPSEGLVEQWDGTAWSQVDVPAPGLASFLYGADATSASDVWAVGNFDGTEGRLHGLAIHWDGTAWSQIPVPDASPYANVFMAVEAIAPDDVWATGYRQTNLSGELAPLAEHWDGVAWTIIHTPNPPGREKVFWDISAASSADVWAVGTYGSDAGRPMMQHWDGVSWTEIRAPGTGGPGAVEAVSSTDVWAVGSTDTNGLTWHWNGAFWRQAITPTPGDASALFGLAKVSSTEIWAVGTFSKPQSGDVSPLTIRTAGQCH